MSEAPRVLTFEDLKRITGYTRRADVERTLHEQEFEYSVAERDHGPPWI